MQHTPKSGQHVKYSSHPDLSVESYDDENHLIRNINIRKRKNPEQEQFTDIKNSLLQSFREMMNVEISEIKEQNKRILESNNEIIKLLQINAVNYKEISDRMETVEKRNAEALQRIDELELQLNETQKKNMRNMVEIRNVSMNESEDVREIVKNLYSILQTPHVSRSTIYRKGKKNAPIIIEFLDMDEKETFLQAFKKYNAEKKENPLSTENLGVTGVKTIVYVSEPLTLMSKKIFAAARELVKNGMYKFCWTSRGNILLRKEEGKPAIAIKSLSQVRDLSMA